MASYTIATASQVAIARWLLSFEMGEDAGSLAAPVAAERVFKQLSRRLADLITTTGSEALLARAVHVRANEFPFLRRVATADADQPLTARLRASAEGVDADEAPAGFLAVLGTLIALLSAFIGEDLTVRLLRDVWPGLPVSRPGPESPNGRMGPHP